MPITPAQAALVDSGTGMAGDIASSLIGINQARINRQFNREEAQKARDWSYKMWQLQNEYDSPKAKMQRLVAAGLNPNLAYGSLDAMGNPVGTSEQAHSSAMPSIPNFSGTDLVSAKLAEAQINRLNTQNDNDTKMTTAQLERFAYLNDLDSAKVRQVASEIELCKSRNQEVLQGIENMKQQWSILDEQKKQAAYETAFIAATQDLKISATNEENRAITETAVALAVAKVLNIKADTALKWSQSALNKQLGKESESRIKLNDAQMAVAYKQAELISSQIATENVRTESVMYQVVSDKNYYEMLYGGSDGNWFQKGVSTIIRGTDAAFRCLGQLIHGTSVVHQ